jgi:hypothetical protein
MRNAADILYGDWERTVRAQQQGNNAAGGMLLAAAPIRQNNGLTAAAPTVQEPRVRANNPGNLHPTRNPNNPWQGQVDVDEREVVVFDTVENGLRAMALNLLSYHRRGINTVDGVVFEWDRSDPDRYGRRVAAAMGVARDEIIDLSDPAVLARIIPPMIQEEHSARHLFSSEEIDTAIRAARSYRGLTD